MSLYQQSIVAQGVALKEFFPLLLQNASYGPVYSFDDAH